MTYNEKLPVCDTAVSSKNDDDEEKDSGDKSIKAYYMDRYKKKYVIPNLQKPHLPNQDE